MHTRNFLFIKNKLVPVIYVWAKHQKIHVQCKTCNLNRKEHIDITKLCLKKKRNHIYEITSKACQF